MSEKRFVEMKEFDGFSDICDDGKVICSVRVEYAPKLVGLLNKQQATITSLQEENKALKKFIKDNFSEMMDSKMVIDDEPFKFNKNCAKPYEIRSVSSNGVVRVGKKNSKVSWRMKDVREISQELSPFEDFNHETLQEIRNKFHTKFDNDVTGRIIYNIYIGTFEEYI